MLVAGAIAAVAVLIVGARWLLAKPSSPWRDVVPAVATVVLVAVTSVYVWLTYRLVSIQSDPSKAVRAQVKETAVATVARAIATGEPSIREAVRSYPVRDLTSFPDRHLVEYLGNVKKLEDVLLEHAEFLPDPLNASARLLLAALLDGDNHVLSLTLAVTAEGMRASKAGEPWSEAEARSAYYATYRDIDARRPEWEDLLDGASYRLATDLAARLRGELHAWYQPS